MATLCMRARPLFPIMTPRGRRSPLCIGRIHYISGQPKGHYFGFRFQLVQKHFGNILPFGRKKISTEGDHFGRNYPSFGRNILLLASNLSEYFGRKTSFRPKLALSAEIRSFGKFLLSAKIAAFQISSFGFGRNSFG